MHDISILVNFVVCLSGALVLGFIAHFFKISPIIGYLLAGVLIGPFTPGFVADRLIAEQFAEIGVILLLFGIGLKLHLRELFAVWNIAIPGALIQSTISTFLMAYLLRLFGWDWSSGIVLGIAISVASTVVMALVLGERHDLHSPIGHIAIGWTVVEDLLTVAVLLLLPLIFEQGGSKISIMSSLGLASVKLLALLGLVYVLGTRIIPRVLEWIEKTRQRELFTLAVLVIALGLAVGSAEIFGVSMALGAFLAGLSVGQSDFAARAAGEALPMRDAFSVIFFVSVGMLFDPSSLISSPLLIAAVLAVVVIGKPLAAFFAIRCLGASNSTAAPVAVAFGQIGEFSFIVGSVAKHLGILSDVGWNALVATSFISISMNPTVYRLIRRLSSEKRDTDIPVLRQASAINMNHCILVGYGPVGKSVYGLLINRGSQVTVIDLNLETVRSLKADGVKAIYGDVLRSGTLEDAGIASSGYLILSANVDDSFEIIRQARMCNPRLRILVRCEHLREVPLLKSAGADVIVAGEAEVGVALVEAMSPETPQDASEKIKQQRTLRMALYGSNNPKAE